MRGNYENGNQAFSMRLRFLTIRVEWYRKAAEQGVRDAQTNLGDLSANGHGLPKDDVEAVKRFRKAAEQGDARAQFDLDRLYEAGRGISRNTVEAYAWFSSSSGG